MPTSFWLHNPELGSYFNFAIGDDGMTEWHVWPDRFATYAVEEVWGEPDERGAKKKIDQVRTLVSEQHGDYQLMYDQSRQTHEDLMASLTDLLDQAGRKRDT
jgi:hypothetical protein